MFVKCSTTACDASTCTAPAVGTVCCRITRAVESCTVVNAANVVASMHRPSLLHTTPSGMNTVYSVFDARRCDSARLYSVTTLPSTASTDRATTSPSRALISTVAPSGTTTSWSNVNCITASNATSTWPSRLNDSGDGATPRVVRNENDTASASIRYPLWKQPAGTVRLYSVNGNRPLSSNTCDTA